MSLDNKEKQSYWKILEFFCPDFNPFANHFSADDVNDEVAEVLLEMSNNFSDCLMYIVPLEVVLILSNIKDLVKMKHAFSIVMALDTLTDHENIGSISLKGCRGIQAGSRKTDLQLAFLELL